MTEEPPPPSPPGLRPRLSRAVAAAVGLSVPAVALAWAVRAQTGAVVELDEASIRAATDLARANPGFRTVLVGWQEAFQARWVNLAGAALCVWVWRRHGLTRRAAWAFVTVVAGWGLANGLKLLVQRARPVVEDAVAHAPGYSFPSGHAMNTTTAAAVVVVLVWPLLGQAGRVVVPVAAGSAVVLTAVNRVLLGVHYPSDVVAGIFVGGAVAAGSYLGFVGRHTDEPQVVR